MQSLFIEQGRYVDAEVMANEVILWRRETLDHRHPDTLISIAKVGSAWEELSRHSESEIALTEPLNLAIITCRAKHRATLEAWRN